MKNAFVNEDGVLTSYGYAEANNDDTLVVVEEDFEGTPGKQRLVGGAWVPYEGPPTAA